MKKILLIILILGIKCLAFGSGTSETSERSTSDLIQGEWKICGLNNISFMNYYKTMIFNGNDRKIIHMAGPEFDQSFRVNSENSTDVSISIYDGRGGYFNPIFLKIHDKFAIQTNGDYFGLYIKKEFINFANIIATNESEYDNFISNEIQLDVIKGSWKNTTQRAKNAIYTFSGNEFRYVNDKGENISGNIKINDNTIIFIVDNKIIRIMFYYISENRRNYELFLCPAYELNDDLIYRGDWGSYRKQ